MYNKGVFTSQGDFLATGVTALMAGHDRMHVVLASDKNVEGYYVNSLIETAGKTGLTIYVQNHNNWEISVAQPENTPSLLVIYGGNSGFWNAIQTARKAKAANSATKIVLVTCRCDEIGKLRDLKPLFDSHVLEAAVRLWGCASGQAMRDILERIVELWPTSASA